MPNESSIGFSLLQFTKILAGGLVLVAAASAAADDFELLAKRCAPTVAVDTLRALVKTESDFNPYAIGVVGGSVVQPKAFHEAMSTIAKLELSGANYSVGLAQINKKNFSKYGLDAAQALDACTNLKAASKILGACYAKAQREGARGQQALHDALSCYYSGNFKTGYDHGYVNKVRTSAGLQAQVPSITAPEQKNLPEENTSRPLISSSLQQTRGLIF